MKLRVQINRFESLTARLPHEPLQNFAPETEPPVSAEDCEAANLTVGLDAPRANCVTFPLENKGMDARQVGRIPLFGLWNPLFDDENAAPDVLQRFAVALPGRGNDGEICVDFRSRARVASRDQDTVAA